MVKGVICPQNEVYLKREKWSRKLWNGNTANENEETVHLAISTRLIRATINYRLQLHGKIGACATIELRPSLKAG